MPSRIVTSSTAGRAWAPPRRPFALRHSLLEARALAGALDIAAVLVPAAAAALALAAAARFGLPRALELVSAPALALALSYFYVCEARYGRTLGKRAFGLRVRAGSGAPAGPAAVWLRTVMRPLDAFCMLGLMCALITGGRVGDWLADTDVMFDAGIPLAPGCRVGLRLLAFPLLLCAIAGAVAVAA